MRTQIAVNRLQIIVPYRKRLGAKEPASTGMLVPTRLSIGHYDLSSIDKNREIIGQNSFQSMSRMPDLPRVRGGLYYFSAGFLVPSGPLSRA
jgi:hypothetical protein